MLNIVIDTQVKSGLMSINNLDIHPKITASLLKAQITNIKTLFSLSKLEVCKKSKLNLEEIESVYKVAALQYCNTWTDALEIKNGSLNAKHCQHWKLETGCKHIDSCLHGGLLYPGITEISGESASGKTQLCLQLCLSSVRNTCEDGRIGSVYVCTEDVFPTKRLQEMTSLFLKKHSKQMHKLTNITDHIFVEHAADLDDLMVLLNNRLPPLLAANKIKLVVVDSIAALFRVEFNSWQIAERAKMLAKVGSLLHKMSHQYGICVVCVNQVSAAIDGSSKQASSVVPALGLTWSYCVNTRIMLSRTQWTESMFAGKPTDTDFNPVVRRFNIVFSSHLPKSMCYFTVVREGIKDLIPRHAAPI